MTTIQRFPNNPIIRPGMDEQMGTNINGPSLIAVPEWLPNPLGRYYLYFAHHHGTYIRLAFADALEGPWTVYSPGTLRLEETPCQSHIASPDVHVDHQNRQIRMYYHGVVGPRTQHSFAALSSDGIAFTSGSEDLGESYFRVFRYGGWYYALGMPGIFYRSKDGLTGFEQGPTRFTPDMRHSALRQVGDTLHVYYTNAHDCPESILHATVDLRPDWHAWQPSEPELLLQPETEYEGGLLPLERSERGWIEYSVRQLRDPCIYEEGGRVYLLYCVAGEYGIAIAELL